MDMNKLTEKSQAAVGEAQALATRQGHQQVESEHLLLALLEQEGGLAETILSSSFLIRKYRIQLFTRLAP